MVHSYSFIISLLITTLVDARGFQAIAFGSRVFTESANTFLGVDKELGDVVITAGNALLIVTPSLGSIKQSNCIDVVNANGTITFSDEQLSFCYEGGPQMIDGATDSAIFKIIGDDGKTSTYEALFKGSGPVVALNPRDRLILAQENVPVAINVGSAFAVLNKDVTQIDTFKIQITQVPPVTAGLLTDASGIVLAEGTVVDSTEVITFTPTENFFNCAPVHDFLLPLCTELSLKHQFTSKDFFMFSIVFGEGIDTHVTPPLPFFFMVELRKVGSLVIASKNIIFPVEDATDSLVPFVMNTSFVSVEVEEEEDADRQILLSFTVESQSDFTIRSQENELFDLVQVSTTTCDSQEDALCRFAMLGTKDAINEALNRDIIILDFITKDFQDTFLKLAINEVEEVDFITFNPLESFEAISFGSRVFSIKAAAFLSFKEGETATVISEGEAVLSIAPGQGKLKQPNCIDIVDLDDVVRFENEELIFCYEGGPQMVDGVEDTLTFSIVGDDGATSSFQPHFSGSDAIDLVPLIDRRILVEQNQPGDFSGAHFAFLREGVTELDIFRIQFDTVPPNVLGTLTTSSGSLLESGSIIRSDQILTFTPAEDVSFCAPLPVFPRAECPSEDENPGDDPAIPSLIFRIILGEDEDMFISEIYEFFYIVETAIADGELVIENGNIPVFYETTNKIQLLFSLNSQLLSVELLDPLDTDYLASLTITVLNETSFSLIVDDEEETEIQASRIISCPTVNTVYCEITLTGTVDEINRALDSNYVTLNFDINEVVTAVLRINLNGGNEVDYIFFQPIDMSTNEDELGIWVVFMIVIFIVVFLLIAGLIRHIEERESKAPQESSVPVNTHVQAAKMNSL